ncbi:polysaccharide deacetylase family protein [Aquimarina sp. MMG016]|uniref:polysaccharide deacetylase family protein n=1 Tax=Aquimarina sp. MMG016 TaxID=2822690 RepID=UPI001B3A4A91|nr:polysaccharide deacetylase family protein [Aquimarina sp. MMG016]MBQ4821345.1 polysaccharide deacetylase family protein [Aquimarina sp. MMG016]
MLTRKTVNITFTIIGSLIIIGVVYNYLPWWSMLLVGLAWFLITAYGVTNIRSGFFLKSYSYNPNVQFNTVAITFDDGPDENTLKVLEVLDKYEVKATFFCIGKQIETFPEIAKQIVEKGHIIGNHTYTHAQLIDIYGTKKFTKEITDTDKVLRDVIGKTSLLFRPPYGVTNPNIAKAVKVTGHKVIGWNKRSFDTTIPSEKAILKRVTKGLKKGDVILLHDTKNITISVLEQLLLFLQKNNFTTVTIDELFSIPAYA